MDLWSDIIAILYIALFFVEKDSKLANIHCLNKFNFFCQEKFQKVPESAKTKHNMKKTSYYCGFFSFQKTQKGTSALAENMNLFNAALIPFLIIMSDIRRLIPKTTKFITKKFLI